MSHDSADANKTVEPIMGDVAKRLDGIVRRHHGRPKPAPEKVTYRVPAPPRAECKGQRKLW